MDLKQPSDFLKIIKSRLELITKKYSYEKLSRHYDAYYCYKKNNWGSQGFSLGVSKNRLMGMQMVGTAFLICDEYNVNYLKNKSRGLKNERLSKNMMGSTIWEMSPSLKGKSDEFHTDIEFNSLLPKYLRAIEDIVIPMLNRYNDEELFYEDLLQYDPKLGEKNLLKLSPGKEERVTVLMLMKAKKEGKEKAIEWARHEMERFDVLSSPSIPIPIFPGMKVLEVIECPKWTQVRWLIDQVLSS